MKHLTVISPGSGGVSSEGNADNVDYSSSSYQALSSSLIKTEAVLSSSSVIPVLPIKRASEFIKFRHEFDFFRGWRVIFIFRDRK